MEYEAENNQQQHSKQSLDKILAELKELDVEINALYQEKEVQDKIVESYREEEKALNAEVEKILDERKRVRGLQVSVRSAHVITRMSALPGCLYSRPSGSIQVCTAVAAQCSTMFLGINWPMTTKTGWRSAASLTSACP